MKFSPLPPKSNGQCFTAYYNPNKLNLYSAQSHSPYPPQQIPLINVISAPHNSYLPFSPPQITPSGLVFWQGRVKRRSGLTLPNVPRDWQPLRVGLSKQANARRRKLSKTEPNELRCGDELWWFNLSACSNRYKRPIWKTSPNHL